MPDPPAPVHEFINVDMANVIELKDHSLMFSPTGFGLNWTEVTSHVDDMTVSYIIIPGVAPPQGGPYRPASAHTWQNVRGYFNGKLPAPYLRLNLRVDQSTARAGPDYSPLGPYTIPSGWILEFNVAGPNAGVPQGTGETTTATEKATWERINFNDLTYKELKCAEKQLNEGKQKVSGNDEVSVKCLGDHYSPPKSCYTDLLFANTGLETH